VTFRNNHKPVFPLSESSTSVKEVADCGVAGKTFFSHCDDRGMGAAEKGGERRGGGGGVGRESGGIRSEGKIANKHGGRW
jgi:hypothetical protein